MYRRAVRAPVVPGTDMDVRAEAFGLSPDDHSGLGVEFDAAGDLFAGFGGLDERFTNGVSSLTR